MLVTSEYPGGIVKTETAGPSPGVSDSSVELGWDLRTCIPTSSPMMLMLAQLFRVQTIRTIALVLNLGCTVALTWERTEVWVAPPEVLM